MSTTTETVWYRNVDTDVVWEVVKGSPLAKRLQRELTEGDNPENRYERVAAPKAADEPKPEPTRAELNAAAAALGIAEPEKLANKQAVIDAIAAKKAESPAGA